MAYFTVKIKSILQLNHDVLQIITEKPSKYRFSPGQATDIAINKSGWTDQTRPFTFSNLPDDDYLEFIIKVYPSHKGVTNELLKLKKNDSLILHDVYGAIEYQGEGLFIAGGAGVTPFISILRYLHSKNKIGDNKLVFANKTKEDIICQEELNNILGDNFINILSDEKAEGYAEGFITEKFLKSHINNPAQNIYLCGPPPMMEAIEKQLAGLKIDKKQIVKEGF
jgi:ferredoxin-NADP reductase